MSFIQSRLNHMEVQEQRKERDKLIEEAQYLEGKGIYTPELLKQEIDTIQEHYAIIVNKILGDQNMGDC